jgi:hypothetical protein
MHVRSRSQVEPFVTLDGSQIREWAGTLGAPARNQSLAEATIPVGGATTEHYHRRARSCISSAPGRAG